LASRRACAGGINPPARRSYYWMAANRRPLGIHPDSAPETRERNRHLSYCATQARVASGGTEVLLHWPLKIEQRPNDTLPTGGSQLLMKQINFELYVMQKTQNSVHVWVTGIDAQSLSIVQAGHPVQTSPVSTVD